jgi:rhodanese-related sulfurtransferase
MMTAKDLMRAIDAGAPPTIVDVRSAGEFAAGHIPGALNVPFTDVKRGIVRVPKGAESRLVLYCGHGPRAWIAAAAFRRRGYRKIEFVRGHMASWRRAGLPEQRSQNPEPGT